jgi:chromosome segregation ATPase
LTQDEQRLDRAKSDLAGANAELAQLKRRMDELNAARAGSERLVAVYTERVVASQRSFDASCANDPNCPVHQSAGEDINRRAKLVENALIAVSTEMSKNKTSIDTLEKNIEPLRREYAEKRCNNLIAGETQQATIDRCAALFSDWNRLQAELNLDNRELAGLKSRYEQLLSEFRSLDVRAQENQKLVAAACKVPPAPQPGQLPPPARSNFDDVRRRADNMGRELDAMINTVGRLRGIQITVEGK